MPLVFKASSRKGAFFWRAFILNNYVQISAGKQKSIFIELTSFSSLFLVNFHVSILDESHHLLIKLWYTKYGSAE